ncbi:succinate dehydrogenase assembly factor 2 [Maritalea mediterranea]|uniref:FAD assembly factor SdhE n=1 Tax=Maritalea mediterranea TaxID=2909667 RepID=A0ABS9E983_9HYPH|nr:succinate dehydrogenase assembly factor 2 [Maritalea mediterranea]MCF4098325.1 succinate dehydrogenase assembly factor 2 [Maritalea mediterranea]
MTSATDQAHIDRLKRIKYRAHHRGTQEMDIILGGFVDSEIKNFDAAMLDRLEALMNETDADLYQWIIGQPGTTQCQDVELLDMIIAHQREKAGSGA